MTCKSPTHRQYGDARESMVISAGQIVRDLSEARAITDEVQREIAVEIAMGKAAERIEWSQRMLARATLAVDAHFDRGCADLAPMGIEVGKSYTITTSGVTLTGKVTSATADIVRIKITHARQGWETRLHYSVIAVSPTSITSAVPA